MVVTRITGTDGNQYDLDYTNPLTVNSLTPVATPTPIPPTPIPPTPTPTPPVTGIPAGWPNQTNTGPAAGTVFTDFIGEMTVTTAGAIIKNLRVKGCITVTAPNVVVQDCIIDASGFLWGAGVPSGSGALNLKVTRCHISGNGNKTTRDASHVLSGVYGGLEVSYCDIHGCENAVCQDQANAYFHDNYFHDFANWPSIHGDHTDGIQTYGWANTGGLRIVHNTILALDTCGEFTPVNNEVSSSAIALSQNQHDLIIDSNFLAGGTYTIYGNAQAGGSPVNTKVTNNRFSIMYRAKVGEFGTNSGFAKTAAGFVWSGNVIHETNVAVSPA